MKMNPFFLFFLLLSLPLYSQSGGLLWEISGNGLKKPSYLLGTYHGTYDILYDFTDSIPGFQRAFKEVEKYVGEITDYYEFYSQTKEEIAALFPPHTLFLPDSITYENLLNPEDFFYLDSVITEVLQTSIKNVPLSPNFLGLILGSALQTKRLTEKKLTSEEIQEIQKQIMDIRIIEVAKEKGLETEGLERMIDTLSPLLESKLELREDAKQLVYGLKRGTPEFINNFTNAYRKQNLKEIEETEIKVREYMISIGMESELDEFLEKMAKERNLNWMEKIPSTIHAKPTLIGVGVRHLPGEMGLINLLCQKGYTIVPVTY